MGAGASMVLSMYVSNTVLDVKNAVTVEWGMPTRCQDLFHGNVRLNDGDVLGDHYKGSDIRVDLLLSLAGVCSDLESGSRRRQWSAFDTLKALGSRGGETAVLAVSDRLRDVDAPIRLAAVEALGSIVTRGDSFAVSAVLKHLEHVDADVRRCAVDALGQVALRGDDATVSRLVDLLEDDDPYVREACLNVLGGLAEANDLRTSLAVSESLHDEDPFVRGAAVKALGQIAEFSVPDTA